MKKSSKKPVVLHNNKIIDVNPGLVTFNTTTNYNVGDYLFVDADFSRYQTEIGQTGLLDLYKTTGNADVFAFSYVQDASVFSAAFYRSAISDYPLLASVPVASDISIMRARIWFRHK